MGQVTELVVAQFVSLLVADYGRWVDGTRDGNVAVGELVPSVESRDGDAG